MDVDEDDNEYLDNHRHHPSHRTQGRQGLDGGSGLGSGSRLSASDGYEDFQTYDDEGDDGMDGLEGSSSSSEVFWGGSLVGVDNEAVTVQGSNRSNGPDEVCFSGDDGDDLANATVSSHQAVGGVTGGRYPSSSTGHLTGSTTGSVIGSVGGSGSSGVGSSLSLAPPSRIGD